MICQVAATSGNEADMSVPLRKTSFTRDVPSTTLTPRWPSRFHSHTQAGPDGSGPAVASIGDNGFGGIDDECPRRGCSLQIHEFMLVSPLRRNVRSPVRIAAAANKPVATHGQTANSPP